MDRDVAVGHVSETYDEPARYNQNAVQRILDSKECTVRFEGKTLYSDYEITDYDRDQMRKMMLAYRYLSLDAGLREKWRQEEASLQAAVVAGDKAVANELRLRNRQQLQENAVKMYQALAEKGDAYGQLRMGEFYRDGDGVPIDENKAKDLLAKSAAQGNLDAARALDKMNASHLK